VRCALASFKAENGTLKAQTLVLDSDTMLINGEGSIHLDSETLDLALRGYPKGLRLLRLRSPVLIRGSLTHPEASISAHNAVLAIVDPGLAKNADCAALLAAQPKP